MFGIFTFLYFDAMIKVQSTVYPKGKPRKYRPSNLTLGQLNEYWSINGSFNNELYLYISSIKAKDYVEN